jgi:hypothetical protein
MTFADMRAIMSSFAEAIISEGKHLLDPRPTIREETGSTSAPLSPEESTLLGIINAHVTTVSIPAKGVYINAPSPTEIAEIADDLENAAKYYNYPVEFFAAAMCQESLFSVNCRNGNFLGKNPNHTNEGTDWGPGQVNGANLPVLIPSCNGDWDCLIAKATSVDWALPQFVVSYAALVEWADEIINRSDASAVWADARNEVYAGGSSVDPKWQNRFWLAALGYNRGRLGALTEVAAGNVVRHPDAVATYCNAFSDVLKKPRIMPDANGLNL